MTRALVKVSIHFAALVLVGVAAVQRLGWIDGLAVVAGIYLLMH